MPFCSECGNDVTGKKFCAECGTKVAAAASAGGNVGPASPKGKACADANCSLTAVPGKKYCVGCHNVHVMNTPTTVNPVSTGIAAKAQNYRTIGEADGILAPTLGQSSKVSTREQAAGITSTVRAFTNAATEEQKNAKYNQQKWGMFETNYQRNKGITTEQSLQEIEAVMGGGVRVPGSKPGTHEVEYTISGQSGSRGGGGGGNKFGSSSASSGNGSSGGGNGLGAGKPLNAGKFGGSSFGGTTTTTTKVSDEKRVYGGQAKFGASGAGGAAFLQNHLAKEKAKYAPKSVYK